MLSRMGSRFSHTTNLVDILMKGLRSNMGLTEEPDSQTNFIAPSNGNTDMDQPMATSSNVTSSNVTSSKKVSAREELAAKFNKGQDFITDDTASDAIGVLQQQLKHATQSGALTLDRLDQSFDERGCSVEFIRPGGLTDSAFGDATCRRCNGHEALGSGLFMRCEVSSHLLSRYSYIL